MQVHACHGPARQIDVLREVLLGLLEDDPTLQPRDIVVMCPDIDTYAPLIVAGFGLGEVAGDCHPAHRLRVRLADRALTQTNPLLSVAAELLTIAETRAIAERDAGAHPVGAARPAAQHERKPLAQPAFHAAGSDQHQFLRERVGLGIGQQRAEPVGKQIGALGTVQVKRHRASP